MAGIYQTETVLQLILDKSSLVSASKGIAEGFNKTLRGVGESFQAGRAGQAGIYGYQGPGAGLARGAGKIAGGMEGGGMVGGFGKALGPVLKALGPIAIIAIILSEMMQFIKPFIKLVSLVFLILFIPVIRALKSFLTDMPSKMEAGKAAIRGFDIGAFLNIATNALFKPLRKIFLDTAQTIVEGITVVLFDGLKLMVSTVFEGVDAILAGFHVLSSGIADFIYHLTGGAIDIRDVVNDTFIGIRTNLFRTRDEILTGLEIMKMNTLIAIGAFFTVVDTVMDTGFKGLANIIDLWMKEIVRRTSVTLAPPPRGGGLGGLAGRAVSAAEMFGPGGRFPTKEFPSWLKEQARELGYEKTAEGTYRKLDDFISRPGFGTRAFNPNDTIIGMKDLSKLKGNEMTLDYRPTYNISAGTDRDELRRIFVEHDEKVKRELQSALSYVTNLRG